MNKIMKKALSLALALVMMLSLAPMTALAAGTGTESDPVVLESTTTTITSDGSGQSVYYVYEAPVVADYEILVKGTEDSFGTVTMHPLMGRPFENYAWNGELYLYAYGTDEVAFNVFDYVSQELTITITMIEGTEVGGAEEGEATGVTPEDAIALLENPAFVAVPGTSMVYYKVSVEEGAAYTLSLYNRTGADFDLYMYNPRMGNYGYYGSADNGILDAMITAESTEYVFAIGNPNDLEVAVQVSLTKEGGEEGGEDVEEGPAYESLVIGEEMNTIIDGTGTYWYTWTAAVDGKITITPGACEPGWTASVFKGASLDVAEYVGYYDSDMNETFDIIVSADETILLGVNTLTWEPGIVSFTATFEEGVFEEEGGDDEEDVETPAFEEVADNAALSFEMLQISGGSYSTSLYEYTVYAFEPVSTGSYTITSDNCLMGIVSYNGMWITVEPSAETVASNEIKWDCTSVGQSIWIAVKTNDFEANITVAHEDLEDTNVPEWYYGVSAETYVFTGNELDLTYVNVEDATEDKAVLGKDGYYHLNSEKGPILLVNLMDDVLALGKATGTGKVAIAVYDEAGKLIRIENWNSALDTYVANLDSATGLYPLTEELMHIYQVYGEQQQWYTNSGFVGGQLTLGNAADAWMFACMYIPNAADGTIVVPPVVVAPEQVENNVVKEEVLEEIIKDAVAENKPVVVPTTTPEVSMTFDVVDLKDAEAVNLNIKVEVVEDVKDETVAKNDKITDKNFVLKVEFAHDGKLPAKATITIAVPAEVAEKYDVLYYYEIKADGTLEFICEAPVDANGNAKVTQDHCSDYVLLTEKIVEEAPKAEAPDTGDATNFALWIAVLGLGVVAMAGSVVMKKREF